MDTFEEKDKSSDQIPQVLGIKWDVASDNFILSCEIKRGDRVGFSSFDGEGKSSVYEVFYDTAIDGIERTYPRAAANEFSSHSASIEASMSENICLFRPGISIGLE
ncbi:hypothetical protein GCK32_021597, partial [Trichostrongylus colubriformis]